MSAGRDAKDPESYPSAQGLLGNIGNVNGIERIGDRQDSGAERDVGASDSVGIPRSIPAFMVMGDQDGCLLEEGKRFKERCADARVILDRVMGFWFRQVEMTFRKHQETDVVEVGSKLQLMQLTRGKTRCLSEAERD